MNRDDVIALQSMLHSIGYSALKIDGVYEAETASAYAKFLRYSDLGGFGRSLPVPPIGKPWWKSGAVLGAGVTTLVSAAGLTGLVVEVEIATQTSMALLTVAASLVTLVRSLWRQAPIDTTRLLPGIKILPEPIDPEPKIDPILGAFWD